MADNKYYFTKKSIKKVLSKRKNLPITQDNKEIGKILNWYFEGNNLCANIQLNDGRKFKIIGLVMTDIKGE